MGKQGRLALADLRIMVKHACDAQVTSSVDVRLVSTSRSVRERPFPFVCSLPAGDRACVHLTRASRIQ